MEDLLKVYENTNVYAVLGLLYLKKEIMTRRLWSSIFRQRISMAVMQMILDNLGASYYFKGEYEKANEIYERVNET